MTGSKDQRVFFSMENLAAFLGFSLLTAFFYAKVLFDSQTFVFVDSSRFFYPFWKWGAQVLGQGLLPLWNPDAQFGTPHFADPQMACAYPPLFLLYSFLSPLQAFNGSVMLHHSWILFGFWVFARSRGISRPASLYGSLAFGFSLHVICSSWTPPALFAMSWIPWIFWAADRVQRGEKAGPALLTLFLAFQFSAGYPVLGYLTGFALFLDLWWGNSKTFPGFSREDFRWLPRVLLCAALAVGANLVWGLPFWELFKLSNYSRGAEHFQALGWKDLATWIAPFYQGHPLVSGYHGPHYWIGTYFMGLPTVVLALGGLRGAGVPRSLVFGWILFFILCLGETLWLGGWLKGVLPGYQLVIRSGFWLPLFLFWTARLACAAYDQFQTGSEGAVRGLKWLLLIILVYGAAWGLGRPFSPAGFGASLLLVLAAILAPGTFRSLRWALWTAALVFSLAPEAQSVNITLNSDYYSEPPAILEDLSKPGRLFFSPAVMAETHVLKGDNMEEAYEAAKQRLYPNWPLAFFREEAQVYNSLTLPLPGQWALEALKYSRAHSRSVLDLLNARYVLGKVKFEDFKPLSSPGEAPEAFENPTPLAKWFSVLKAWPASSWEGDFSKASRGRFHYGRECFIADSREAGDYMPRTVRETARTPQKVELTAEGKGKALLVSSETDYPGWKAAVEGREKGLEQVNHVFRGVVLGEGEHRVVVSYEPATFRLGLFLSFLSWGFWLGLAARGCRR